MNVSLKKFKNYKGHYVFSIRIRKIKAELVLLKLKNFKKSKSEDIISKPHLFYITESNMNLFFE